MRKRNWLRKAACAGLVLTMTAGLLGACGKEGGTKGGTSSADPALAKQYVFSYENMELPGVDQGDNMYFDAVTRMNDRIYMVLEINHWSTGAETEIKFMSMKEDGTDLQTIELQMALGQDAGETQDGQNTQEDQNTQDSAEADKEPAAVDNAVSEDSLGYEIDQPAENASYEYTGFSSFAISKEGRLYAVKDHSFEDYSDENNIVSEQNTYICAWDFEGKMLWEQPLENLRTEEAYNTVRAIVPGENDSATLLVAGDSAYKLNMDAEGNLSPEQELPNGGEIINNGGNIIMREDGSMLITYYDENWTDLYISEYDVTTDTLGEKIKLPAGLAMTGYGSMSAGVTTDIIYSTTSGIYGFNIGDEESTQIMSFINSDLNTTSFNNIIMLSDTQFFGFYRDNSTDESLGAIFTKRNPEDIPDKQVIVIAGVYVDYDMRNRVVKFNKENENYRIVLKEYESYNTPEDYTAGITQLNNDIIAGNMPDILIVNNLLPIPNYISKGLAADIGKLIAEDEELSKTEFVQNAFDAYKVKDKLYYVIPSFYVNTVVAKSATLGDRTGWTVAEFLDYVKTLPEGTALLSEITMEGFINAMMQYCGSDFVDVSTGKCNFNSEQFIGLLEFAKTLPKELPEDSYGEGWWENYQSQYREDRTVLMPVYISNLRDMNRTVNGFFGEEITYIGFPSDNGKGTVLEAAQPYILSARSKNLDGAWQFIRYYLTEEYQKTLDWNLPVSKKAFMEKAKEATEKPYYLDENGKKVETEDTFSMNGEEITLEPLTQAQVDQLTEMIFAVDKRSYYNEAIQNIVTEEAAAFLEGQKSASEVAQIIQSRAQIYVDENQ